MFVRGGERQLRVQGLLIRDMLAFPSNEPRPKRSKMNEGISYTKLCGAVIRICPAR